MAKTESSTQLIFVLQCIKSEYPRHLMVGVKYKVDVNDRNNKEIATFWFHPLELIWVFIGYFPLECFDAEPIKKYLAAKKNPVPAVSQRERALVVAPAQRQRPESPVMRERPIIMPSTRCRAEEPIKRQRI